MDLDPTGTNPKRKRGEDSRSADSSNARKSEVALSSNVEVAPALLVEKWSAGNTAVKQASVLAACRAALVKSNAASQSALAKHRTSICTALAKALEIVGAYTLQNGQTPLHESVANGDVITTQCLIAAGAYVHACSEDRASPIDLATDVSCRDVIKHHTTLLDALQADPSALVPATIAHCSAFSSVKELDQATALPLHEYHIEPSFSWAPRDARNVIFSWARDIYTVQIAAVTQPFVELPDDCAGDILEYFDLSMTRLELLNISANGSSSEAVRYINSILSEAITAGLTVEIGTAARAGDLITVQNCLRRGANVDARFAKQTPLILAARNNYTCIVETLLRAGADTEETNEFESTALTEAAWKGHTATVKLLLDVGANASAKEKDGKTALIYASSQGLTEMVELLLAAGADTEASGPTGNTALMEVLTLGHTHIAKLLIEAGADANAKNVCGDTALIFASLRGPRVIVELLLEAGADKDIEDMAGKTAEYLALVKGHMDIHTLLLDWSVLHKRGE